MPPRTENNIHDAIRPAGQDGQVPQREQHNNAHLLHHTPALPQAPNQHGNHAAKATITIATLNINGFNAPSHNMTGIEKWSTIHRIMSDQKIAILAIQETHLDEERLNQVAQCFGKRLTIISSPDPETPRASAGVAFVINKRLIKPTNITVLELFEGRALALKIKWHETEETTLLNIYAPNTRATQPDFWRKIDTRKKLHRLRNPAFMLGDFNVTEDAIDRYPPHLDDINASTTIREIRHQWRLHDAWRHAYPNHKVFTYRAIANNKPIKSRLDRIYIAPRATQHTFNWQHCATPVPTDHWLVSVKFAPLDAPYIGNGRWTWNIPSLQNKKLITAVVNRGIKLQADTENATRERIDRNNVNPQLLWKQYKEEIKTTAKQHNRDTYHKLSSRVTSLRKDLHNITQHPDFNTDETLGITEAFLAHELEHLEKRQAKDKKDRLRTEIALHG
jgi:exonuclease III